MEPSGIIFTERREQPIKQWPFPNKKVGATTKAKRHPQTRRFMFMREDHDRRNLHDGPVNPDRLETKDWAGVTRTMKKVALDMGAEIVGVAPIDEFDYVRGTKPPEGHKVAISFAIHMDFEEMKRLGPLAQMEVHKVYYLLSDVSVRLAQYIRSYGYHAVGYPNEGDILFIPVAWKAGLGELGRHGSLITKKYGPSVRLGAVTTEMPLIPEAQPANYGFDDFCLRCNACTNLCPGDAIVPEKQDIFGILRWHVDTPQCRPFFEQYEGCKICLTVCPINAQTHVQGPDEGTHAAQDPHPATHRRVADGRLQGVRGVRRRLGSGVRGRRIGQRQGVALAGPGAAAAKGDFMFFELRQYKTKPGQRDAWVKTMEEKILPFHAANGVVVSGSFTGRDDGDTYVWLRRFDSQEQKEAFAKTIAESDYWKNEVVPDIQAMLDREAMVVTALEATALSVIN